ncbi:MAG: hypothetical protein IJW77_09985 [Clostridia bacterium]|nr:hypothetical protein [Clostridia bacterium]
MSKKQNKRQILLICTAVCAVLLIIIIGFIVSGLRGAPDDPAVQTDPVTTAAESVTEPTAETQFIIETVESADIALPEGLVIDEIGSYTGLYMEDGSDEILSGILMMVVTNHHQKTLQYADICLTDGTDTAVFSLSTLPSGESAVLLEQNRMTYEAGKHLTQSEMRSTVYFSEEPSLCEDKLSLQALNGVMNVTNITDEDITGDIAIYYKNASADMLYGGITYRVTIRGGLAAGEVRQIAANHFSASGSRIMFVTVG